MPLAPVTVSYRGPLAVVTVDDGATNLVNVEVINALLEAFGAVHDHLAQIFQ